MRFTLTAPAIQLVLYLVLFHEVAGRAVPAHLGEKYVAHNEHHQSHAHVTEHYHDLDDGFSTRDINVLFERAPQIKPPPRKVASKPVPKKVPTVTTPRKQGALSKKPAPKKVPAVTTPRKQGVPSKKPPSKVPNRLPNNSIKKPPTVPQPKPLTKPPTSPGQSCSLPPRGKQPTKQPLGGPKVTARNIWYALTRRTKSKATKPGDKSKATKPGDKSKATKPGTCANQPFVLKCAVDSDAEFAVKSDPETTESADAVVNPKPDDPVADLTNDLDGLGIDDPIEIGDDIRQEFEDADRKLVEQKKVIPKNTYSRSVKFTCEDPSGFRIDTVLHPPDYPTPNQILKDKANIKSAVPGGWWFDRERMKDQDTDTCDVGLMNQLSSWGLQKAELTNAETKESLTSKITDFHTEHVYEINFIPGFLTYLREKRKISCYLIRKYILFRPREIDITAKKDGVRWTLSGRLMDHLVSRYNRGGMAVLDKNLNGLKYRILREKDIISLTKFAKADLDQKITTFRRLMQTMEYLHETKDALKKTKTDVEKELTAYDAILTLKLKPNPLVNEDIVSLASAHDAYIKKLIEDANIKATKSMEEMLKLIDKHKEAKPTEWNNLPQEVRTKFQKMIDSKGAGELREFKLE